MDILKVKGTDGLWHEIPALKGEPGKAGPQGQPGAKGDPGTPGHTPEKGVDYWTEADKTDIVNATSDSLQPKFDDLHKEIEKIVVDKLPNVTFHGTPVINGSQMSGFSPTSYATFPFLMSLTLPFEIKFAMTTGTDVTTQQNILDSDFGLALAVRSSHLVTAMSTTGTNWDLGEGVGTLTIQPNTSYLIMIKWDGSTYSVQYSVNAGASYTIDIIKTSTSPLAPKQIYIGVGENNATIMNSFKGIIDFEYASLSVNGNVVWLGYEDVGLASRMAVNMNNIDDAGKDKLAEVASEKGFVKGTDYATDGKYGVVRVNANYALMATNGYLYAQTKSLEQYKSLGGGIFIGKGTLEKLIGTRIVDAELGEPETFTVLEPSDIEGMPKDVTVNGVSVLNADGVANIPIVTYDDYGVARTNADLGINTYTNSVATYYAIRRATNDNIDARTSLVGNYRPIVPSNLVYAVNSVLCSTSESEQLTSDQQLAARQRIGLEKKFELIDTINVSEDASVILTAEPNGTPYNFKHIYVEVAIPPHDTTYSFNVHTYDEKRALARTDYSSLAANTNTLYTSAKFEKMGGIMFIISSYPTSNGLYGGNPRVIANMGVVFGNVKEIRLVNSKVGTVAKIYGVRA